MHSGPSGRRPRRSRHQYEMQTRVLRLGGWLMVFIIAEIGVNHCGSVALAEELISQAHMAGADCVKFQTFDCEKLDPPGERREMLRKLQFAHSDFHVLNHTAAKVGIEFISTPFDVDSLRFLVGDLKVKTLKIASGNLGNLPLLEAAGASGCDVILSTGMATIDEIAEAAYHVYWSGVCYFPTVLHCTSAYPTPLEAVNLNAMVAMNERFKCEPACPVGLSDHTEGITVALAAAALGAVVIEKHITLDRTMPGPDHRVSLEPDQFAAMVQGIRDIEKAMGDGVKGPQKCEIEAAIVADERKNWRDR